MLYSAGYFVRQCQQIDVSDDEFFWLKVLHKAHLSQFKWISGFNQSISTEKTLPFTPEISVFTTEAEEQLLTQPLQTTLQHSAAIGVKTNNDKRQKNIVENWFMIDCGENTFEMLMLWHLDWNPNPQVLFGKCYIPVWLYSFNSAKHSIYNSAIVFAIIFAAKNFSYILSCFVLVMNDECRLKKLRLVKLSLVFQSKTAPCMSTKWYHNSQFLIILWEYFNTESKLAVSRQQIPFVVLCGQWVQREKHPNRWNVSQRHVSTKTNNSHQNLSWVCLWLVFPGFWISW